MSKHYHLIENYSMKCRLYPNKTQAKQIDTLLHAVHAFYNMALYDMRTNFVNTKESQSKADPDQTVHFPDFNAVGSKAYKDYLKEQNEIIQYLPSDTISSTSWGLVADMQKAWKTTGKHPVENFGQKYKGKDGQFHEIGCSFYSKRKPRTSYAYKTTKNNIAETDNPNVFRIKLKCFGPNKFDIGWIKIKGVNTKLRFDENLEKDFAAWIHDKGEVVIRISKDNCGDYWIVFSLKNVYKSITNNSSINAIGIDVGEIDIASLSDGTKYDNIFDHNPKVSKNMESKKELDRKLSRRWGWRKPEFRAPHKKDKELQPSKRYDRLDIKHKKVSNTIARQRTDYYNKITAEIVSKADIIAIESLSVKDMFHSKGKEDANEG